mmetsp:Transcript_77793/g.154567  ORF Transcript_77793/g.154567 Transcript_77793/m.154567 type:complete len:107 (+) Transcript_77793:141-461(+)
MCRTHQKQSAEKRLVHVPSHPHKPTHKLVQGQLLIATSSLWCHQYSFVITRACSCTSTSGTSPADGEARRPPGRILPEASPPVVRRTLPVPTQHAAYCLPIETELC